MPATELEAITIDADPGALPAPRRTNLALHVTKGPRAGEVVIVEDVPVLVGRGENLKLSMSDPTLSRQHARFERDDNTLVVEDLGSRNGTFVDGKRVMGRHKLKNGDVITMGNVVVRFGIEDNTEVDASRALYEAAVRDRLTKLYNRGFFDDRLEVEFKFSQRQQLAMSLIIIDLDHFKQINDNHGHPAGDAVLRATAATLTRSVRAEDVVARLGGEEFAVLARGTNEEGAKVLSQRLRTRIGVMQVPTRKGNLRVTASLGVAVHTRDSAYRTPAELIAAADEALYAAKRGGRDRVVVHLGRPQPTEDCDTAKHQLLRARSR